MPLFQELIFLKRFNSRKLLTSIKHIPVKVRWKNTSAVKYYSSWRKPIFLPLFKVVGLGDVLIKTL